MTHDESAQLFQKGLEAGKKRNYRLAIDCFSPLTNEDNPQILLLLGRSWHGLGEFSQAVQLFQSALNRFGPSPEVHFFLGRSLLASGQPHRALSYLEKAREEGYAGFQLLGILGSAYLKTKNPTLAVEVLGQAVEAAPAHRGIYIAYLNALVVRAVQLFHQGDYELSRQMLDFLVKSGAESPMIERYLAASWRELGRPDMALPHLEKALADNPEDSLLIFQHVEALFHTGRADEARVELAKVRHLIPEGSNTFSSALLDTIMPLQALQQGNLRKAVFFALKNLKANPGDPQTSLILAEAYRQLGQLEKAENHFEVARKSFKNHKEPDYGLMMVHWQQGNFSQALQEAQRLLKRDPQDPVVFYYSVLLQCRLDHDPKENIQALTHLIKQSEPDPFLFAALAGEYAKVSLEDLALPWVKRALKLDPENKTAMDLFAALLPQTDREDWKPYFLEYLKLRPKDQEILKIFIPRLIHAQDFEEAQTRLVDWIALGHRSTGSLRSLAYVYRMRNLFHDAFLIYRDLLHGEPQNPEYISSIILCLYKTNRQGLALEFARKAVGGNPHNAKLHHQMGQIFMASGDLDQARKAFNKALEIDTKHWPSVEKLAEIYEKENDGAMAERYRKYAENMKSSPHK